MATTDLTMAQMDEMLDNNDILVIDFWAEWCGPCKQFGPVYETVSEKFPDVKFTKCDTEKEQDLAGAFGIQSIPTLAIFREKILLFKQAGALGEAALEDLLNKVKELDMDEVREQIAEAQKKEEN